MRVNDHETEWAVYDMVSMLEGAGNNLDIIIIPKVKKPSDLLFFETMLLSLEKKLKIKKPIGLEVLIEEAEGLGKSRRDRSLFDSLGGAHTWFRRSGGKPWHALWA